MERFELKRGDPPDERLKTCRMVNPLTTLSVACLYIETLLIIYLITQLDFEVQRGVLIIYILILVVSYVLTNTSSALMVRTSTDFKGSYLARVLCFALHLCQLSLLWRFSKLVLLYDKKDWHELANLRLIHTGLQTIPFILLQGHMMFYAREPDPVTLLAIIIALMSAALSVTMFCVRDQLHCCSSELTEPYQCTMKRYCGVFMLLLGTILALAVRFSCIILMALIVNYFVVIPLGLHMFFLFFGYLSCTVMKSETITLRELLIRIGLSYLNTFDLVEVNLLTVQCKYVSFYTAILIENIIMIAAWLLRSELDYISKLIAIVTILAVFICALVLKFTSCGILAQLSEDTAVENSRLNSTSPSGKTLPTVIPMVDQTTNQVPSITPKNIHVQNGHCINGDAMSLRNIHRENGANYLHGTNQTRTFINGVNIRSGDINSPRNQINVSSPNPHNADCNIIVKDQTGIRKYNNSNTKTYIYPDKRHKNSCDVSLDVCSSNSRNTNTLMTSANATSETSTPYVNDSDLQSCVPNRHQKRTIWQKMNLKFPNVSYVLERLNRRKTELTKSLDSRKSCSESLKEIETCSPNINNEMNSRDYLNKTISGSLTDVSNSTAVCVGTPRISRSQQQINRQVCQTHLHSHPQQSPSGRSRSDDRVNHWLANMYGSHPILACRCNTESHSSDCTYAHSPQSLPPFQEFMDKIPSHSEHVLTKTNQNKKVPPPKPKRLHASVSNQFKASSELHVDRVGHSKRSQISIINIKERPLSSVLPSDVHTAMLDYRPNRQAFDDELRQAMGLKTREHPSSVNITHKRSFSDPSIDILLASKAKKTWLTQGPQLKKPLGGPNIIRLGTTESLV